MACSMAYGALIMCAFAFGFVALAIAAKTVYNHIRNKKA